MESKVEIVDIKQVNSDVESIDDIDSSIGVTAACGTVETALTFQYVPTGETWKESWTVEVSGFVNNYSYSSGSWYNSYGDPGDPPEESWDSIDWNTYEGYPYPKLLEDNVTSKEAIEYRESHEEEICDMAEDKIREFIEEGHAKLDY